jgi:hypothetical protein
MGNVKFITQKERGGGRENRVLESIPRTLV